MKKLEVSTKEYQQKMKTFEMKRDSFDKQWGPVKAEHAKLKDQISEKNSRYFISLYLAFLSISG